MKYRFKNNNILITIVLFIVLLFIIFWRLGNFGLANWDEAIYADIARNVINGDIFSLKWGQWDWFQKPPLFMWVEAMFFSVFGVSEYSARLTSALSGFGLSIVVYLFSAKLFNKKVAIVALITILLNSFLLAWFRFATTDIFALFLNTLAVYYFWLSQEDKKYLIWCFVMLGLAGLVKGPVVVAIGLTFLIYLIFVHHVSVYLKSKYFWVGLLLFLLIVLPWHFYMLHVFDGRFIDEYFIYHIFTRAKIPIEGHIGSLMFYPKLILKTFPLSLILLFSVFLTKEKILSKKKELFFLLVWMVLQYISIAKVATVLDWYILPVFIPMQILSAVVLVMLYENWKTIGRLFLVSIICFALVIEFWKPYAKSWTDTSNSKNDEKECIIEYNKIPQDIYYFYGYDFNLPAIIFYLNSTNIIQVDSLNNVLSGKIIMINKNINHEPLTEYQIIKELDGCIFVKK